MSVSGSPQEWVTQFTAGIETTQDMPLNVVINVIVHSMPPTTAIKLDMSLDISVKMLIAGDMRLALAPSAPLDAQQ